MLYAVGSLHTNSTYGIIFFGNNVIDSDLREWGNPLFTFCYRPEGIRLSFTIGGSGLSAQIKSVVESLMQSFLEDNGFELVDVEYVKEGSNWFLRLYVDKEGGIDIDDCGRISEFLSEKLDENDPIPTAYFLEVSSPGAERPLKKIQDYYKAVGEHVFVTTYELIDGLKEFEGKMTAFDEQILEIQAGKKKHAIPYNKVASARLAIEF
jgi:ribosome maturation factor RimP